MRTLLFILLSGLCATAQSIMPPMPEAAVGHALAAKQHLPQPIILSWSKSISPAVKLYSLVSATNGISYAVTNVIGTTVTVQSWPGENEYFLQAIGSNGYASQPVELTHSGWDKNIQFYLSILTNSVPWTNIFAVDSTNLNGPAFFRSGSGAVVVLQQSSNCSTWNNILSLDDDTLPNDFTAQATVKQFVINAP